MNGAHGFQFTPLGILRGDQPAPPADADMAPAAPPQSFPEPAPGARTLTAPQQLPLQVTASAPFAPAGALTGKQIVKQCKDRMRVLEKALREVPQMQEELESLRRLVEAASRPAARVVKLAERTTGTSR